MKCKEPTKKSPNGRTGTNAGIYAHRQAGEEKCEECAKFQSEYNRAYREANAEKKRESDRSWRERNLERKRESDRRYYRENADKIRKRAREWHHDNREKANEYSREWRRENQERFRQKVNQWHRENRTVFAEYLSDWRERNKDLLSGYSRKRRMALNDLPFDGYLPEDITAEHGKKCYLCEGEVDLDLPRGSSLSPQIDHMHPVSRDGCPGDVIENVRWTHAICNIKKGDKLVKELTLPFAAPNGKEWT